MTRRANEPDREAPTTQFTAVDSDDAFLTALSRGEDPSAGADPLAGLFLAMRSDVERPMPGAPLIDAADITPADTAAATAGAAPAPVAAPASNDGAADELARARARRAADAGGAHEAPSTRGVRRSHGAKKMSPWVSGLVGAAAGAAVIAGSGAALYNATPGSPLWGPSKAIFGDRAAVVELASTLDQLEVASQAGDSDHVNTLLQQARALVGSLSSPAGKANTAGGSEPATETSRPTTVTVTVTVTTTPEAKDEPASPAATVVVPSQGEPQTAPSSQSPVTPSQQQGRQPSAPQQTGDKTGASAPATAPDADSPRPQVGGTGPEVVPPVRYGANASPNAGAPANPATGSSF